MLGSIAGDIIGSVYEHNPIKEKNFPLFSNGCVFTDDTVMTIAVAEAIINQRSYVESMQDWGRRFPWSGYGGWFRQWIYASNPAPYNSFGNGSAMRVSAVGWLFDNVDDVLEEAKNSAEITHNHPEGVKGAQATALAVFLARNSNDKATIQKEITERFGYDLSRRIDEIRPDYSFDVTCQGTVPEAVISFLESESYEDAVRNAVSLGGDADTLACITGGIAEAYYGSLPDFIHQQTLTLITSDMRNVLSRFNNAVP